jgi:dTDP-4-amino-4,6-dideoxygalactose transaminase
MKGTLRMKLIPQFKVRMNPETPELLASVFDSGYIGQGPKVDEFEAKLAEVLNTPFGSLARATPYRGAAGGCGFIYSDDM